MGLPPLVADSMSRDSMEMDNKGMHKEGRNISLSLRDYGLSDQHAHVVGQRKPSH